MPVFGHVATAMATPFTDDGGLDLDGAQTLARHLVDTGTDCVVVAGTTGESPTLHGEETWDLLDAVIEAVGEDAKVIVGTGSNDTRHSLEMTERANAAGVDGVLVVTPYYNKPNGKGQLGHFGAVADASVSPVLLYDIPGRSGVEIPFDVLVELAQRPDVVGVKDATGNVLKASNVLRETAGVEGGFEVYSGSDELNLPFLAVGASGIVSVASHLVGPQLAELCIAASKDLARATAIHQLLQPLVDALFSEPSPAPLKGALAHYGLPGGPVRLPLAAADQATVDAVVAATETIRESL